MTKKPERDVVEAQRDAALDALDDLERIVRRIGGYMTMDDQRALNNARAVLVEQGKRKSDAPPVWTDRPERPKIAREHIKLHAEPAATAAVNGQAVYELAPPGICNRCGRPMSGGRCGFCQ